jgi:hypothetical protein
MSSATGLYYARDAVEQHFSDNRQVFGHRRQLAIMKLALHLSPLCTLPCNDADGAVTHVVLPDSAEVDRTFSERVAERLRQAHFLPGEVDGKAVKSQVRIVVVSKRLPPADNTQ